MEWVSPLKPSKGHKPVGMSYRSGKHLQFWWCLTEKTPLCLPWTWHTTRWHEKAEMAPKSNATCIDKIWTMLNMVMVQPLGWSPPILGHQDITCIVFYQWGSRVHVIRHGNHLAPINSHIIPTEKSFSWTNKYWATYKHNSPGLCILDTFLISQVQTTPMLQSS